MKNFDEQRKQCISTATSIGSPRRAIAVPARQHGRNGVGHDLRETGDVLAMEGGLRQPPLLEPEIAVAGQQPLSGDAAEQFVLERGLAIALVVLHQDVAHVVRLSHQVDGQRADRIAHDAAILARDGQDELVRPLLQDTQLIGVGAIAGAGRRRQGDGLRHLVSPLAVDGWELRFSEYTL